MIISDDKFDPGSAAMTITEHEGTVDISARSLLAPTGGALNCHKFSLAFLSNPLSKTPRVCAFEERTQNNKMRKKHILHGAHTASCRRGG